MKKIILCMHTSLDGFVAGPNGEMDWIKVDEELFEYSAKLTEQADTALYGRVTYQMMDAYWPSAGDQPNASKHDIQHSQWYKGVTKMVISNTLKGKNIPSVQIIGGSCLVEQIQELKQRRGKSVLIFGSPSASHSLMQHNLIDEYWLFVNPLLLGVGIPSFKNIKDKINLRLVETNVFSSGVIGLHYEKS